MQYISMTPEGIARERMLLIYCIQSEGLVNNYFIALCFHGYNILTCLHCSVQRTLIIISYPQELCMKFFPTRRDCII